MSISLGTLATLPSTATTALIAGWISMLTAGETFTILQDTGTAGITVQAGSALANQTEWTISARNSSGADIFLSFVVTTPSFRTGWHSYAVSMDTSTNTLQLLIDLRLFTLPINLLASGPIAFFPGTDTWFIGPVSGGTGYGVDVSNFRFGAGEPFFDLSNAANVAKLFGDGNAPVYWGPDGSAVTGFVPAVYLSGNSANYADNLGSGGSSSPGTLTDTAGPSGSETTPGAPNVWFQVSVGGKFSDMSLDEWDGNYEIFNVKMPAPVTFQQDFAGSPAPDCQVAPASTVTLTFQIISGTVVETLGTITIPSGTSTGSFSTSFTTGPFTIWPGQNLRLHAPSAVDTTIVGLSATIVGVR